MREIKIILLVTLLQIIIFNTFLLAEEKHKVLLLHIIEENWDDLELLLPLYRGKPDPVTKKEALKGYKEYKESEENARISERKSFKGLKKEMTIVTDEKTKVIHELKYSLSEGDINKDSKFFVYHKLRYYGKTYLLKEEDTFIKDAFRFTDKLYFNYSYNKIPEKISLLTDPTKDPGMWGFLTGYAYIRLVEDIYILSYDEIGNLKIKYNDNEYNLNVGSFLELPPKEADLTREEMTNFKKYYEEKWGFKVKDLDLGIRNIASSKNVFHFGTKVTLMNYGYEELE